MSSIPAIVNDPQRSKNMVLAMTTEQRPFKARCIKMVKNYTTISKVVFMEYMQQYDKFSGDFKDKYKKSNYLTALGGKHTIGPKEAEL